MICPPLITKLLYQLLMILAKHEKNKIKKNCKKLYLLKIKMPKKNDSNLYRI